MSWVDRAGAAPDVFTVLAGIAAWLGGEWVADFAEELEGFLVHAHDRVGGIVGPGVDREDVLHRRGEGKISEVSQTAGGGMLC